MASPRRAVLRRSGDETAAASAMLNTFFRDARMFSGTIWAQRVAYKIVSNDTTSKVGEHPRLKRLGQNQKRQGQERGGNGGEEHAPAHSKTHSRDRPDARRGGQALDDLPAKDDRACPDEAYGACH